MAAAFNLTAQINLRGPTNTRAIASQMRKQLSDIKVKVNLDLKGAQAKNVATLNKQLVAISKNAALANKNITNLSQSVNQLGAGLSRIGGGGTVQSLAKVQKQAASAGKSIDTATSQIQEFGKQSGLAIRRFAAFSAVTGVVYSFTNAINSAYKEFVQFDRQLVRLSQVTGTSVSGLKGISDEITNLSTNLGVASTDLLQVSVTLAQAGLSAQEAKTALEALAKSALAPSFDNLNDTVEGSIALMKQFSLSSGELEGALGSINAVAAAFAVEAGDIIKAIQRTGGVFASASNGVSQGTDALNEFVALFTSVRATTREGAETIATGLRTIFTRIQRGSTIDALKEFGITLTDLQGKFVGPYEAIRRLSEGLQGLDPRDLRFGQIVEELGGFRQIGKVIPLIQQFSTAQKALAVAQGGQGSLTKAAIQAQASLAVQFEKTRQSFVALVRDIGNSTTFRTIASVSLTTANAFISLAGALKPLLPMLTALAAIKGASILSEFGSGFLGGLGKSGGGGGGGLGGILGGGGTGPKGGKGSGSRGGKSSSAALKSNTSALTSNTSALNSQISTMADLINTMQELSARLAESGGGDTKGFARGGLVPGSGNRDTVSAMLTPGEYVIRKKAVEKIGAENLEELNRGGRVNKYARGGRIAKIQAHDAYDGDSWHVSYIPESSPVGPITSRGEGYDAYEVKKGLKWERALGQKATEIADKAFTDSRKMSNKHSMYDSLTQGQSVGGRPVHSVPDNIINEMVAAGVALRTSNKDNVATGYKQSEEVKKRQIKTLRSMGNQSLVYDRERSKFAGGGGVQKGKQFGGVGIFDSDMIGAGAKEVLNALMSSGKPYDVISGPAGSGKTTFATERFGKNFVLSAEDLANYSEFMVLSGAGATKSGGFSGAAVTMMSGARKVMALRASEERVMQQRQTRLDEALRSGSPDRRSVKQLQGTLNAPASISSDLYSQFGNVEFIEKFAGGGGVHALAEQKGKSIQETLIDIIKENGGIKGIKKLVGAGGADRTLDSILRSNSIREASGSTLDQAISTVNKALSKKQNNQQAQQAKEDAAAAYGLVGLYGSPRDVIETAADGSTVKLVGRTLDRSLSDQYESMMIEGFEKTVSDVGRDMASKVGASTVSLNKNQMDKAGLYNAIGAYLEASIATLGAPYDKDESNDPLDFADGLGAAAGLFNLPAEMPADTTRTVFGKGKSPLDFLGQVNRFRAKQAQKFAKGGEASDTVPALLTPGEYVINKEAAKKLGSQKLDKLNKADKIQGYASGGAVGFVQRLATGGGVEEDKIAYVGRMAEKLGLTIEQYEKTIQNRILNQAEKTATTKQGYQGDLLDVIVKNLESIGDADVEDIVRSQIKDLYQKIYDGYGELDDDLLNEGISEVVEGMKSGMSIDEIKQVSIGLREALNDQVTAGDEVILAQEKMAKKLGFLTEGMKVKDVDVRARESFKSGKLGAMDKPNLRRAQRGIESGVGKILDDIGRKFSTANLPGMQKLSKSFPDVANKVTMFGDKLGGLTGILGTGATLLSTQIPKMTDAFDRMTGSVSKHSETLAGITGALQSGGSFGVSGAILGQQAFGRRGAAVGGAIGLTGGAISGFIKESTAKELENAMRGVTVASNDLDKTFSQLEAAQTIEERQELVQQLNRDYENLNQALAKSADEIESNRIWNALSSGLDGFLNGLTTVIGFMAAARMSSSVPTIIPGGGGGRRRRGRRGAFTGGRIGFASGGMVPVKLASGEGVFTPPLPTSESNLDKMNMADKNGYVPKFSGKMGIVPGKGPSEVDTFDTSVPEGTYIVRAKAMEAIQQRSQTAAVGGRIINGYASGGIVGGYNAGGSVQGYFAGGGVRAGYSLGGTVARVLIRTLGPTIAKGLMRGFKFIAPIIGYSIIEGLMGFMDNSTQEQQLQAQVASLEQLRKLVDLQNEAVVRDPEARDRQLTKIDAVEQANLTAEQRRREYSRFTTRSGEFNELNFMGERNARAKLSASGFDIDPTESIQQYLDSLSGDERSRAEELVTQANQELAKRIFIEARQRQDPNLSAADAEKEFNSTDPEQRRKNQELMEEELGSQNRRIGLSRRMATVQRELQKYTLNLTDVMNRLGSVMGRITQEIVNSTNRLSQVSGEFSGAGASAGAPQEVLSDVLENITAYSAQELSSVVDSINQSLGDTKETQQMGDMIKGMQILQKELPLILRDTADNPDLNAGAESNIRSRLDAMFQGVDISGNIKDDLKDSIINYITDETGNRQGMSYEDLANNIKGLKELDAAAEKARQTFADYAQKQMELNRQLASVSNQLSGQLDKLKDNTIQVRDIQLNSAIQLADQFNRTLSLGDLNAPFQNRVSGLTGGVTDPAQIGQAIADAIAQKRELESDPNTQTSALGSGQIAKLTSKINRYQQALETLAKSTDTASNALKKIDEQQRISSGRRSGVMDFLANINNPEALLQMRQEQISYSNVMGGTGTVYDISEGIKSLRLAEQTQTPEEFARTQERFFQNAMTILEASGANPAIFREFREMFSADFGPQDENPAIKPFVDAYQQAIQTQTEAVHVQSNLIRTGAETAAMALSKGADDFTSKMRMAAAAVAAELNAVADRLGLGQPLDAQKRARGGIIYASAGQFVNFQPKGTDTVPAMLTPGEFVVNRAATQKNLPLLQSINSGGYSSGGAVGYYATGGQIGPGNTTVNSNFNYLKPYKPTSVDDYDKNKDIVPFEYIDQAFGDSDSTVSTQEVVKINQALSDHKNKYFSSSAKARYNSAKVLIPQWKAQAKEGKPFNSGTYQSLEEAQYFAARMEAAHGISPFGKDSVGNAPISDPVYSGRFYGGDKNFPMEDDVRAGFNDIFERSIAARNAVDLEAYFYGLASKALPFLGGIVGGGLGAVIGTALGLPTGGLSIPIAVGTGAFGGAMVGNYLNNLAFDWLPSGFKDRIIQKVQDNPGSYSAGQWTGFAGELLLGDMGASAIARGISKTAAPRVLAKAVAATKTGVSKTGTKVQEAVEKGRKLLGKKAAEKSVGTTSSPSSVAAPFAHIELPPGWVQNADGSFSMSTTSVVDNLGTGVDDIVVTAADEVSTLPGTTRLRTQIPSGSSTADDVMASVDNIVPPSVVDDIVPPPVPGRATSRVGAAANRVFPYRGATATGIDLADMVNGPEGFAKPYDLGDSDGSGTPQRRQLPDATVNQAAQQAIEQDTEQARRFFSRTNADIMDSVEQKDSQGNVRYGFGQVIRATNIGLKDPLGLVDFLGRSITIPAFELGYQADGSVAPGQLLTQAQRKAAEEEYVELNKDLLNLYMYSGPKTKNKQAIIDGKLLRRQDLKDMLDSDYRAQFNLGVPQSEPVFNLQPPTSPTSAPPNDIERAMLQDSVINDNVTLQELLSNQESGMATQSAGPIFNRLSQELESIWADRKNGTTKDLIGRYNRAKDEYLETFGPVSGVSATPIEAGLLSQAQASEKIDEEYAKLKAHIGSRRNDKDFMNGSVNARANAKQKARTGADIQKMMKKYSQSGANSPSELKAWLEAEAIKRKELKNKHKEWDKYYAQDKEYRKKELEFNFLKERWEHREAIGNDPETRIGGGSDLKSLEYVLFNHPPNAAFGNARINPFSDIRTNTDEMLHGIPGRDVKVLMGRYKDFTQQAIINLLTGYGQSYGIQAPANKDIDLNQWLEGIDPDKVSNLTSNVPNPSWKLDTLKNMYGLGMQPEGDTIASRFGLWSISGAQSAFNDNFGNEYQKAFLKKAYAKLNQTAITKGLEAEKLSTDSPNTWEMIIDALDKYTSQMDPALYRARGQGFAPLRIAKANPAMSDAEKIKQYKRDVPKAYQKYIRKNFDFIYGGYRSADDFQAEADRRRLALTGEELREIVLTDRNMLKRIRDGYTSAVGGGNPRTSGQAKVSAGVANLFASAGSTELDDATKNRFTDLGGNAEKANTILGLLSSSLDFGKRLGVNNRQSRIDYLKDFDFSQNARGTVYEKYEENLDNNLEKLKPTYNLWDSLKSYAVDSIGQATAKFIDPSTFKDVTQTKTAADMFNIAGKNITGGEKFVDSYAKTLEFGKSDYQGIIDAASILQEGTSKAMGSAGAKEFKLVGKPTPFDNKQFIVTQKYDQLASINDPVDPVKKAHGGIISAKMFNTGGRAGGTLVNYAPSGTDTVPAMLTPGEFVVNRAATKRNLPLLKSINNGSSVSYGGGMSYAQSGGIIQARGYETGGLSAMGRMVGTALGFDTSSIENVFNTFVRSFSQETSAFGGLINNLARVFPALSGPVNNFGTHVDKLVKALDDLKTIEIKGPNIPEVVKINSDTIRVELIAPENTNYKLSEDDKKAISNDVASSFKRLIELGRYS